MKYKRTERKLPNGIEIYLQGWTQREGGFTLEIGLVMPSNDRGGVALYADDEAKKFLADWRNAEGWTFDTVGNRGEPGISAPLEMISYAVNGCTGGWYDGKGDCTQKKVDAALDRAAKIATKYSFDK